MVTLELEYSKHIKEDNIYQTWKWDDTLEWNGLEKGWYKLPKPNIMEHVKEMIEWYIISNEEDKHFLQKELEAFREYAIKFEEELQNDIADCNKSNSRNKYLLEVYERRY